MKRLIPILIVLATATVRAQVAPNLSGSVPGSMNATAASKDINIPVNYHTGIPSISIPIYNYSAHGMNLPISLDYNAGGIKVDEQATNVGLGWKLNAGGSIVRSIRGLPDDYPSSRGYLYSGGVRPYSAFGPRGPQRDTFYYVYNDSIKSRGYSDNVYAKDSVDSQLDIYQFNAAGRSGSFIIGKGGKVTMIPLQNTKVSYKTALNMFAASSIFEFTLTFEDGVRYVFNATELTSRKKTSEYDKDKKYVTAWFLTKIVSPFNQDSIIFKYNLGKNSSRIVDLPATIFQNPGSGEPSILIKAKDTIDCTSRILTEIDFPYGQRLFFGYDAKGRCDIATENALRSIEIRDTILRRGFRLEHGYFSSVGRDVPYDACSDTSITRLKLKKVIQYSPTTTLPPYEFFYARERNLPRVGVSARDFWGYFNNKYSNDPIPSVDGWPGADRTPDSAYTRTGTLTAIKYPTGAYNYFEYETNDFGAFYYLHARNLKIGPDHGNVAELWIRKVNPGPTILSFAALKPFLSQPGTGTRCQLNVTIKTGSGQVMDQFAIGDPDGVITRSINLPAGIYAISWVKNPANVCADDVLPNFSVDWQNEEFTSETGLSGGIRIRKITTVDKFSRVPIAEREFRYKTTFDWSSGFRLTKPEYAYTFTVTQNLNRPNTIVREYHTRVGEALNNMDFINGPSVGYSRVEELVKGNGKIVYEFTSPEDIKYFQPVVGFPFAPLQIPFWELGLPKRTTVYDTSGKAVRLMEHEYAFVNQELMDTAYKSYKLNVNAQWYSSQGGFLSQRYGWDSYYPNTGKSSLIKTTTKDYLGTDSTVTETSLTYDGFYNLTKQKTLLDKDLNKYSESRIYYPYNYTITGPIKDLKDKGIMTPVSTENWLLTGTNQAILDGNIIEFVKQGNGSIVPKRTYALESSRPVPLATIGAFNPAALNRKPEWFRLQQTVEVYDDKNNPLQVRDERKQRVSSTVWDKALQTPVASVSNALYKDIAYTSFEGSNGNWTLPANITYVPKGITGRWAALLNGNITATISTGNNYWVSFWSSSGTFSINDAQLSPTITRNGWNFYQMLIFGRSTVTITGNQLILDELRLHPYTAMMNSASTEFALGTTSANNENNQITAYIVDDLGRQKAVIDADGNIQKVFRYKQGEEVVVPCAKPENLIAYRSSADSYALTWDPIDGSAGYIIEYHDETTTAWTRGTNRWDTASDGKMRYFAYPLPEAHTYTARVSNQCSNGLRSAPSNTVTFKIDSSYDLVFDIRFADSTAYIEQFKVGTFTYGIPGGRIMGSNNRTAHTGYPDSYSQKFNDRSADTVYFLVKKTTGGFLDGTVEVYKDNIQVRNANADLNSGTWLAVPINLTTGKVIRFNMAWIH